MLNVENVKLAQALCRAIPGLTQEHARSRAAELIAKTDSRLEPNIVEWMEGRTLSDVWIGKYCINAIMAIRKDRDFLGAWEAMNLYLHDPAAGELLIWRARR